MSAGFTKGPWAIYRQPLRNRIHACWELARLVFGTNSFVPSLPMIVSADGKCPAVTGCGAKSEANAHLIAAAPDMYGEAEFLLDRLGEFENDLPEGLVARDFYGHIEPSMARLRAILAKARGEA